MTTQIDTVVFDLGNVLIDWNPRYLFRRSFGGDDQAMERFLAEVFMGPAWNEKLDAGRPWEEVMALATESHPHHAPQFELYRTRWQEALGEPIPGSLAIFQTLKRAGMPLYALTNWSHLTFPHALDRYPFLHDFDEIVVSGQEGLIKPDPALFKILLARTGIEAGRSVFIDDNAKNIATAHALGFHAVHFQGAEDLERDLRALGLPLGR